MQPTCGFIVRCDAGYNIFFLNARGNWTVDREHARIFVTKAAARRALWQSYKTARDSVTVQPA